MRQRQTDRAPQAAHKAEPICWREILDSALSGLQPADQQIERMLDYLERRQ
jgi:hypothetical protein